jgi:hypothetical protein
MNGILIFIIYALAGAADLTDSQHLDLDIQGKSEHHHH